MKKSIFIAKSLLVSAMLVLASCQTEDETAEEVLVAPVEDAGISAKSGATLDRTTGIYRAAPGTLVKVDYSGQRYAPCLTGENLKVTVYGQGLYKSPTPLTWTYPRSASFTFRMPATGFVNVEAVLRSNDPRRGGCSKASVKLNGAHEIRLGSGGFVQKFPSTSTNIIPF